MMRWVVLCLLLSACAASETVVVEPQREPIAAVYSPVPKVIGEAMRAQKDAAYAAATRNDLTTPDLLRMLDLSQTMQRAVRRVRAHRSAANVRAAREAVDALREFMR